MLINKLNLLDCTLRDGGYVNNWHFGNKYIKAIVKNLTDAKINYIECGFLEDITYDEDKSLFNDVTQIEKILPEKSNLTEYLAMSRLGRLSVSNLKPYDGKSISGLRISFHVNEVKEGLELCRDVKDLGYKVFVQPVGTTSYSDDELLLLINKVNILRPFAFYFVDTLGVTINNDIQRMFYITDHNLDKDICLGYHAHNNLQMAFSNAQDLANKFTKRELFLDSSVSGMGRGAGNLNTELIAHFLNSNHDYDYNIDSILRVAEENFVELKPEHTWGYSVPYYLAAINNCHPNYATYLINKKTLDMISIGKILISISYNDRELYNEGIIQQLYLDFQKNAINDSLDKAKLMKELEGKKVLLIAPGKSIVEQKTKIQKYISDNNPIIVSVNFADPDIQANYLFFSNKRRFDDYIFDKTDEQRFTKTILTSNIEQQKKFGSYILDYSSYINDYNLVKDNAMLMLLKLLNDINVKHIAVAGFDGYTLDELYDQYFHNSLETHLDKQVYSKMNEEIKSYITNYQQSKKLEFITDSLYN